MIVQHRIIEIVIYFAFGNGLEVDEEQNKIKYLLIILIRKINYIR